MAGGPTAVAKGVYSVWALPPEDVRDRLKSLMGALRSEFGGPKFEPHITVVGAISLGPDDALRRFRSACTALSPYPARVSAVSRGAFFYQCVFLLIDPSPEVVETSALSCGHFGYENATPYMPHLSLLYGDLTEEEKERARQRVEALDKEILSLSFEVSALALYKTDTEDKSLESWEQVELCHLSVDK
ncbi:unnamed protein product [Musa acuminata subsp. malaccensis]|uniref:(wild Malaysian banana) hypothetical protein n=1 Tax=Musa acuminata subsp. malaccensis TaxID=214687 RepID=A0A804ID00_MUSAM|nr:PREDICTED: cyclic phosphodiesterase-like [Musa acuminata subsp. malaccensis]CAG1850436.1 unnamed protein product [Musa acuminata subsp. malaccensis]